MTERTERARLLEADRLGAFADAERTMRVDALLPSGVAAVAHVSVWWVVRSFDTTTVDYALRVRAAEHPPLKRNRPGSSPGERTKS